MAVPPPTPARLPAVEHGCGKKPRRRYSARAGALASVTNRSSSRYPASASACIAAVVQIRDRPSFFRSGCVTANASSGLPCQIVTTDALMGCPAASNSTDAGAIISPYSPSNAPVITAIASSTDSPS